jgi:hypothetical protein
MRWIFVLLASLALSPLLGAVAQAQPVEAAPAFLSVTREVGAESCPDTETLRAHVERLRGHQATSEPSAYRVRFSRQGGEFRADIQLGNSSGARVLRDRRASCASLEQATALTLALLLDSDVSELPAEKEPPPPATPPLASQPSKPQDAAPIAPEAGRGGAHLTLSIGGGALFGVVQPVAPSLLGELGIGVSRFRTGIGVLWLPTQTRDFGPGHLRETLFSGVARTCLTASRSAQLRFDVCSGVYAGLLKVQAFDYTRNDSTAKAWLALPVGVSLSTTSPLGVELGASALLPLRRTDFAIDNLGVAYDSWRIGMLLSMRAVGTWLL